MKKKITFRNIDEKGATTVEYVLLISIVILIIAVSLSLMKPGMKDLMDKVVARIADTISGGGTPSGGSAVAGEALGNRGSGPAVSQTFSPGNPAETTSGSGSSSERISESGHQNGSGQGDSGYAPSLNEWISNIGVGTPRFDSPYHTAIPNDPEQRTYQIDISGGFRQPLTPLRGGEVVAVNSNNSASGFGNYVVIRDSEGINHLYGHLDQVDVRTGDVVTARDTIGTVGNTGNVLKNDGTRPSAAELARGRGAHLHYEQYTIDENGGKHFTSPYGM